VQAVTVAGSVNRRWRMQSLLATMPASVRERRPAGLFSLRAFEHSYGFKSIRCLGREACVILRQIPRGNSMSDLAKTLIFFGIILICMGVFATLFSKVPMLGKLPGDIFLRRGSFTFYLPLTTCVLLSLILTLAFTLFGKK